MGASWKTLCHRRESRLSTSMLSISRKSQHYNLAGFFFSYCTVQDVRTAEKQYDIPVCFNFRMLIMAIEVYLLFEHAVFVKNCNFVSKHYWQNTDNMRFSYIRKRAPNYPEFLPLSVIKYFSRNEYLHFADLFFGSGSIAYWPGNFGAPLGIAQYICKMYLFGVHPHC